MSRKKVIVRRFSASTGGGLTLGYVPPSGFVRGTDFELLDLTGRALMVPLAEIKTVSFVREFNSGDTVNPERLTRKTFQARPRAEGIWTRFVFTDDDMLEGLMPLDISLADSLVQDRGVQFTPPDIRGNVQRLFVPRSALASMEILAVVTTPSRKKDTPAPPAEEPQKDLFADLASTRVH